MVVQSSSGSRTNTAHRKRWLRVLDILRFTAARVDQEKLIQLASSLTFTTVLAIVPLLAVVLSLFTAFPLFNEFSDALQTFMVQNLMPASISDNVMHYLNEFAAQASHLTAVGGVFLVLTALMLIMSIDSALNDIWHVGHQRPAVQRIMVYWGVISLGPILMGASLWISAFLAKESLGLVPEMSNLLELALSLVPLLLTGLGFTLLFFVVPNCRVRWVDAFAGGYVTAILLEIMKIGFAYYVSRFPTYTIVYGAFSTLPVFLLWVYLSWLGVLVGAMVAANLHLVQTYRLNTGGKPGADLVDAIKLLTILDEARNHRPTGLSLNNLIEQTSIQHESLIRLLGVLADLGLAAPARTPQGERWIFSCNPATAKFGPLFDRLAIDRHYLGLSRHHALSRAIADLMTGQGDPCLGDVMVHNSLSQPLQSTPDNLAPTQGAAETHHAKSQ